MLKLLYKKQQVFLAFVFLILVNKGLPQSPTFSFTHLTLSSGLSNSSIRSICQDSSGFIWIGTTDGLNRYDGITFKSYNHIPGDSSSLSDNFIYRLLVDRQGKIWIGTINGLNCFDPATEKFQRINFHHKPGETKQIEILILATDSYGNIWAGTSIPNGVFRIQALQNPGQKSNLTEFKTTFIPFPETSEKKTEHAFDILFRNSNEAWIGTQFRIYKFRFDHSGNNLKLKEWKTLEHADKSTFFLGNNSVNDIVADPFNALWVGYYNGGIDKIIPSVNGNFYADSVIRILKTAPNGDKMEVLSTIIDRKNNIWFGTNESGLASFNVSIDSYSALGKSLNRFTNQNDNAESILSNQVFALFEDNSGLIWIGTDDGISIYNSSKVNFNVFNKNLFEGKNNISITAIEANNEYVWMGSDDQGIAGYNKRTGKLLHAFKQNGLPFSLSSNTVCCILSDRTGNVWIGTTNGLNFIEKKHIDKYASMPVPLNMAFTHFLPASEAGLSNALVYALLYTRDGMIWAGTFGGLDCINTKTLSIKKRIKADRNKPDCLSSRFITCLYLDNYEQIWIGTEDGLNVLDRSNGTIKKYYNDMADTNSLSNNRITSIYQTKDDIYWVGTNGGGLNRFDKKRNTFKKFTTQNGLPNNVIKSIEEDRMGNLWFSTNNGLVRFNTANESFNTYNTNDGLKSNGFNIRSSTGFNGELFFGSINGLNSFYPDQIKKNLDPPPIVITDFKIFDKSFLGSQSEEERKRFIEEKTINLLPGQNFFSFEFAALNYINPEKNQYAYMLEGLEEDWNYCGNRRFASYTNVNPDNYVFRVKASNNDGVWNEEGIAYKICVQPPFTGTWWFKGMIILFLLGLFTLVNRARIRNLEAQKQKELAIHKTQMTEMFLANMSHEIRTPMNAILGMTRLLLDKNPAVEQRRYLKVIKQSSDNLLVILNDILDFSKIEAGKMELEQIPFSPIQVIDGVYSTLKLKAEEKNLHLEQSVDTVVPEMLLGDPVRLTQVLINLVGNAIKFTERGFVKIECFKTGDNPSPDHKRVEIVFKVSDSGIGIDPDKLQTIFESFTQESSDVSRKFGGTGLGLSISKKLVEMQGGTMQVTSEKGKGSEFTFSIPYQITSSFKKDTETIQIKEESKAKLAAMKILLVEDNEFNQMVAVDTLSNEIPGITIDVAATGMDALEKIKSASYDVILMDIQMPEMNGYQATHAIRQLPSPLGKTIIIAMTANTLQREIEKCFEAGMDDFISKPFDPKDLICKLEQAYQHHKV